MTEPANNTPNTASKKPLIVMSILGLLVMAVIAFVFTRPPKSSLVVADLYKYYPENTAFYMEVAPGDKLSSRVFQGVDNLRTMSGGTPGHGEVKIADIFQKDFQPAFTVGMWVPAEKADAAPQSGEPPFLMALPLKSNVTPATLASDLKVSMESFNTVKEGDSMILESKTGQHPPIAFHKNTLLVASTADVLKQALAEYKTPATLLDNPLYKKHLSLLPAKRQGTILALNNELKNMPQAKVGQNPGIQKIAELQKQMSAATPVTVAGINISNDELITLDAFTPVDLAQVENEAFRKDIQTLMARQETFDLPQILPEETVLYGGMMGLGQYYDIYMNHFADEKGKASTEQIQSQLKMLGLDLRKNIISLLDGKSAIGIIAKQGTPDILLFLKHDADTQKTMDQFGMMAAQMTGGKLADKDMGENHMAKVLESPAIPVKVGYSNVKEDTLVLGTQQGLEEMYNVQQKKHPSLGDSKLYKELAATMPAKVSGVFFIDVEQGSVLLDGLAQQSAQQANLPKNKSMKEALKGIDGVAGSNTIVGDDMMKGQLTIKLSSTR